MRFENEIAVITGGGTGIGFAIATKLSQEGSRIILLGRRSEVLKEAKDRLEKSGANVEIYRCDVSHEGEVKETFRKIGAQFERLDHLVNNAGVNTYTDFDQITAEQIRQEIEVKANGILFCTREAAKLMRIDSSIVNITSINARNGQSSSPAYCGANALAIAYTKNLAVRLAPQKIRVNAVAPGFTYPTGFTENYDPEKMKKMAETSLLKRLCAPEDVANAVAFLLSDEASFINGHTLDVNGGYWMN